MNILHTREAIVSSISCFMSYYDITQLITNMMLLIVGNYTVNLAVACTNPGQYDIVMDCREHGGVIRILWNKNMTFFGEKDSPSYPNCSLTNGSCTVSLVDTNMAGRLEDLCDGNVRCTVELEQEWVPEECGDSTLNYMEVTYLCIIPGNCNS